MFYPSKAIISVASERWVVTASLSTSWVYQYIQDFQRKKGKLVIPFLYV